MDNNALGRKSTIDNVLLFITFKFKKKITNDKYLLKEKTNNT